MTTNQPPQPHHFLSSAPPDEFVVYHWTNSETDCEYSYLAINADRSVLLSLGELSVSFDFELPPDTDRWLSQDYAATTERFQLNVTAVRYLIEQTFAGGALFGFVKLDEDLLIRSFELSLREQETSDCGPEYVVHALGQYQRWYRETNLHTAVTLAEHAMLDVCCSTFQTLTQECSHLLTAPPTPWFQDSAGPDRSQ